MKGERKIKIDYVTSYDARNVGTWSGLGHYIAEALKKQGAEINYIGNLKQKVSRVARIRKWWFGKTCKGMMVREDMVTSVMRSYARQVEPRLDPDADILLCPGNYAVTMVRTDKPVVIYGDANYGLLNGYYADALLSTRGTSPGTQDARKKRIADL
ncbi:MAG: hypothetical protein LBU95_01830 [Rikenellaceae bacterium]|jgi:hypothetical protein|nr:hypothetical protein [Rikenellaceae bacterium]